MSRRLNRLWLLSAMLLASQSWALGLGDIRLSSALNEPLRAEIELLAVTPEDLENLAIRLASVETFERYDLDRPLYLSGLRFRLIRSGREDGNRVIITSAEPIRDPFITFLVEAIWSRGHILREYTLLLDPPTFSPQPVTQSTQAVTAPTQATPTDSGQIQRPAPQQAAPPAGPPPAPQVAAPAPAQAPAQAPPQSASSTVVDDGSAAPGEPGFDQTPGGELLIRRGDTLWSITRRVLPDSRLTMNQMMLAIFEANPEAFVGNINMMSAGASLRIPSADDVFRIGRGDALAEVLRQHDAWGGSTTDAGPQSQPALTLVPPDDDVPLFSDDAGQAATDDTATAIDDPDEARISEIEALLIGHQDALIEINDNELAALRAELAELRGEEPPEPLALDDNVDDIASDDTIGADDVAADDVADVTTPATRAVAASPQEDSLFDTIMGYVDSIWGIIGGALLIAIALLVWFARRSGAGDDEDSVWESLDHDDHVDHDDVDDESLYSTEILQTLSREDDTAILVEEQEAAPESDDPLMMESLDMPAREAEPAVPDAPAFVETTAIGDTPGETAPDNLMEQTESGETSISLDQSDPIAEADFHMAYGLYDQAADLIIGTLEVEAEREDLLAKLCEIYFVWGNKEAFIDAAGRMRAVVGGESNADWDKTVIMGQQIAPDHELFSGVSAGAASREVDLAFDGDMEQAGVLDIDLEDGPGDDVMDIGADSGQVPITDPTAEVDFELHEEHADTGDAVTIPAAPADESAELPAAESSATVESLPVEQDSAAVMAIDEVPTVPVLEAEAVTTLGSLDEATDAVADIDLDDLDLDLDGLDLPQTAADEEDVTTLASLEDLEEATDAIAEIDLDDLDLDLDGLGLPPADADNDDVATLTNLDELDEATDAIAEIDLDDLDLDLDGLAASQTVADDDEATTLTNDDDAVFAASDGQPTDVLTGNGSMDEIGEMPGLADSTDMDLDLDNLTGTMKVMEVGGANMNQLGGDTTVEQPAPEQEDVVPDAGEMPDLADSTDIDLDLDNLTAAMKIMEVGETDMNQLGGDTTVEQPAPEQEDVVPDPGEMPDLADSTDVDLNLDNLTAAMKVMEVGETDMNQLGGDTTVEEPAAEKEDIVPDPGEMPDLADSTDMDLNVDNLTGKMVVMEVGGADMNQMGDDATVEQPAPDDPSDGLNDARTMTEVGTKLDLARAYVDMGDPSGARSILDEVLDEGDESQRQQAQQLLESLPS